MTPSRRPERRCAPLDVVTARVICRVSDACAVDASVIRGCSAWISIAMSNIRFRSTDVSTTSGSSLTRSGLVSTVLPSTIERRRCRRRRSRTVRRRSRPPPPNPPPPPPACAAPDSPRRTGSVAGGSGACACPRRRSSAPPARAARRRPPSAGGGAGSRLHAQVPARRLHPGLVAVRQHRLRQISRISRPAASVILSFTSPTGFLLNHEMTAAGGGFSPKKVWSPQNS